MVRVIHFHNTEPADKRMEYCLTYIVLFQGLIDNAREGDTNDTLAQTKAHYVQT
jgi:hypothetical protein